MPSVMEIVVNAQDNATTVIEGIGSAAEETGSRFDNVMTGIAAGSAVAGAGLEAFARNQQDSNVATAQLAASIGVSQDEMRGLATETSNVTFPMEDVLDLMETGRQRGLDSADALQEYATFWDLVGDATGESATQLGKAGAALAAVGIEAGNEAEAMNALGFVHQETTGSVSDFLAFLDRTGPELREMGADVDDAAAILGVMERELGMTGRTARQEFRTAVNESEGDMGKLLDTLGISEDSFASMRDEVDGSSDVLDRNAGIVADSFTPLQKLEHGVTELMTQYGGLAGAAGTLAPVLLTLGPIVKGLTVVFRAFNLTLFTNPIFLIIAAIVALIAIGVLLVKNWDTVVAFLKQAWETIRETAVTVWNAILDFFIGLWDTITGLIGTAIDTVKDIFLRFHPLGIIIDNWGNITGWIRDQWERVQGIISGAVDNIKGFFSGIWNGVTNGLRAALNSAIGLINTAINGINVLIRGANRLPGVSIPEVPSIPRLHDGGVFRAPAGQHEGLALLRDMERVRTPEQEDQLLRLLREIARRPGGGGDGVRVDNLNVQAWSDRFSLRQIEDELSLHGAS